VFATLLGGLPRPVDDLDQAIEMAIRAQAEAGLEPITDGRLRDPEFERLGRLLVEGPSARPLTVDAWRLAADLTDRAVKQSLPGPYSLGRRLDSGSRARERRTLAVAEALAAEVDALARAGCPLVEIEESEAHRIGTDERERRLFREAHRRLTEASGHGSEIHRSLSIVGGSAAEAGVETILDAPYASLAVDLIAGPDNWNLVTRAPRDRGIVAGALSAREPGDEGKEVLLWAAHYAAAAAGRGLVRVGLGSAGSYANLAWDVAVRKMKRLGEAARLAALPPSEELARSLDPRAVSSRRAALGHGVARPRRG
jgi:methionine synthase II (cobalamin-independent)